MSSMKFDGRMIVRRKSAGGKGIDKYSSNVGGDSEEARAPDAREKEGNKWKEQQKCSIARISIGPVTISADIDAIGENFH